MNCKIEAIRHLIIHQLTMGFDLSIAMNLPMCPQSGKPFWYKFNPETKHLEKSYELPSIQVPSKMCEYLQLRGRFLHAYTEHFNDQEIFNVSVEVFILEFPSFREVKSHEAYDEEWIEEDHDGFLQLLEWCSEQAVEFRVSWSY
jgi:hypothetical protein